MSNQAYKMLSLFGWNIDNALAAGRATAHLTYQQRDIMKELTSINVAIEAAYAKLMSGKA